MLGKHFETAGAKFFTGRMSYIMANSQHQVTKTTINVSLGSDRVLHTPIMLH